MAARSAFPGRSGNSARSWSTKVLVHACTSRGGAGFGFGVGFGFGARIGGVDTGAEARGVDTGAEAGGGLVCGCAGALGRRSTGVGGAGAGDGLVCGCAGTFGWRGAGVGGGTWCAGAGRTEGAGVGKSTKGARRAGAHCSNTNGMINARCSLCLRSSTRARVTRARSTKKAVRCARVAPVAADMYVLSGFRLLFWFLVFGRPGFFTRALHWKSSQLPRAPRPPE